MARIQIPPMDVDYYDILKVSPQASPAEIRASFKRLVIASHPDKNPGRRAWSERRVRELIEAYETLGDPKAREQFDRSRRPFTTRASSDGTRAEAMRGGAMRGDKDSGSRRDARPYFFHKKDPGSRAMLILHHLLHGKHREALSLLSDLESRLGKDFLSENLDRDDYLDCLFLLAETHLASREYAKAEERLRTFCRHDYHSRCPRPYRDQAVDLLKDIYLRKFPRWATAEAALAGLEEAALLNLSKAEEFLRLRKLVDVLLALGRLDDAREAVTRADSVFPPSRELERMRRMVERANRVVRGARSVRESRVG